MDFSANSAINRCQTRQILQLIKKMGFELIAEIAERRFLWIDGKLIRFQALTFHPSTLRTSASCTGLGKWIRRVWEAQEAFLSQGGPDANRGHQGGPLVSADGTGHWAAWGGEALGGAGGVVQGRDALSKVWLWFAQGGVGAAQPPDIRQWGMICDKEFKCEVISAYRGD